MLNKNFQTLNFLSNIISIIRSCGNVACGLLVIKLVFFVFHWNESDSINTDKSLKEAKQMLHVVPAHERNQAYEGKLVYVSGLATSSQALQDPTFHVTQNALKLNRVVEMFQWVEKENRYRQSNMVGVNKQVVEYYYKQEWAAEHINGNNFQNPKDHINPTAWDFTSQTWIADPITVGAFMLNTQQITEIKNATIFMPSVAQLPEPLKSKLKVINNGFYVGANPAIPALGDLKISFSLVQPGYVSIIAKQTGKSFSPYLSTTGNEINLIEMGNVSADSMLEHVLKKNESQTWIIRGIGALFLWLGCYSLILPLTRSSSTSSRRFISLCVAMLLFLIAMGYASMHYYHFGKVMVTAGAILIISITYYYRKKTKKVNLYAAPSFITAGNKLPTVVRKQY